MTYCVGMKFDAGLILMSDTRTNAGVDNISTFRKMFTWVEEGERVITLMTAGNLATTQAVISTLEERTIMAEDREPSIMKVATMFQVARLVGEVVRDVIHHAKGKQQSSESNFGASIIVAGQIKGGQPTLFLIYPEGNFIEVAEETPFFQIGETKYGRPILVRAFDRAMSFADATKLLMVSFDSTVKANLSVAPPFDMIHYRADSFTVDRRVRIREDDPQYRKVSDGWGDALRQAFSSLPAIDLGGFD